MDTELGMTWVGAVLYWGTTPRSSKGHCKVKLKKIIFGGFLSIPNLFGGAGEYYK